MEIFEALAKEFNIREEYSPNTFCFHSVSSFKLANDDYNSRQELYNEEIKNNCLNIIYIIRAL